MAAGEPGDPDRGAGRRDAAGVGVRLGEREEGVDLALDQQRRRLDPARARRPGWTGAAGPRSAVGTPGGGHRAGTRRRRRRRTGRRPGRPASARRSALGRPAAGRTGARRSAAAGAEVRRRTGLPPLPKKSPAQPFLKTPAVAGPPVLSGRNARARSFQVIIGTIASTRGSWPASSRARAPPYEPPTTPTRGSPAASVCTSGRAASQSEQPLGVAHLVVGAVQVDLRRRCGRSRAPSRSAPRNPGRPAPRRRPRTESLVPPKPCASSTAGTLPADASAGR